MACAHEPWRGVIQPIYTEKKEMANEEKKKNIFQAAIDALTNRDEKEAEAAKQAAEQKAQAEAARLKAEASAKAAEEKVKAEEMAAKKAADAKAAAEKFEAERKAAAEKAAAEKKVEDERKAQEVARQYAAAAAAMKEKAQVIKHVWGKEDTYASLAFKYYGSIKEPFWRLIYEHNKDIIGSHPNAIREGLEIEIPPLPDELKDKK